MFVLFFSSIKNLMLFQHTYLSPQTLTKSIIRHTLYKLMENITLYKFVEILKRW